jgi:hypothetical protein
MKLYTVEAHDIPVLVMPTDVEPAMEDTLTTNAELIRALRGARDSIKEIPEEAKELARLSEIDEALETWLGADLMTLQHENGQVLWNGAYEAIHVRPAIEEEVARWQACRDEAVRSGDEEPADAETLVVYLVPVSEELDDDEEEDDE